MVYNFKCRKKTGGFLEVVKCTVTGQATTDSVLSCFITKFIVHAPRSHKTHCYSRSYGYVYSPLKQPT